MTWDDTGSDDRGAEAPNLLTRSEASALLATRGIRLKPATLARLWSTGTRGPPCRHIRSKPFYPQDLLEAWAQAQITEVRAGAPASSQRRGHG